MSQINPKFNRAKSLLKPLVCLAVFGGCLLGNLSLMGQGISVTTPFTSASDSFFGSTGVSWGFSFPAQGGVAGLNPNGQLTPQIGFSWGGGGVVPPFGGFNPNAGGQLNIQGQNFRLGLSMAKGSSRTLTSTAPSIIVQNGYGGSIFGGQVSPFVTGVVPVVGTQPIDNAVTRALQSGQLDLSHRPEDPVLDPNSGFAYHTKSSATQGDQSVASIRANRSKQTAIRRQQASTLMAEAEKLLESGRKSMARQKLRKALELTDDEESKKVIQSQIENLRPLPSQR
jgi:hypothetical protein